MGTGQVRGYGERLRSARERTNLTQEQLAERLAVSVASINRWEHERAFPRAEQRQQLCSLYGIASEDLFPSMPASQATLHPPASASTSSSASNQAGTAYPVTITPETTNHLLYRADTPFWDSGRAEHLALNDPNFKQGRNPSSRYFERPHFYQVCDALRNAADTGRGGVVLFGPPMIGKTRMALEALRRECPDYVLVSWPRQEFALSALDAYIGHDVALLLDDLHELTNQYEAGRVVSAVRRLLSCARRSVFVLTCRSGIDEAAAHQRFDGLVDSLALAVVHLSPMVVLGAEATQFLTFARELQVDDPQRSLSLSTFDGTPGSVLLGLQRRTRLLQSRSFPGAAKAALRALSLLRAASIHNYVESRVRRVAEQVFHLPVGAWTGALDYLLAEGWVTLDEGDLRGESQLYLPSDAYLDVCLGEAGVYPQSHRKATSDFPRLYDAFRQKPVDVEGLFALSRAIYGGRSEITVKWNELGLDCALAGLDAVDASREPLLWARGQHILGLSYFQRWQGDSDENARQAEVALRHAGQVFLREEHPVDWAECRRALGITLTTGYQTVSEDMLEEGLPLLEESLAVYTREAFPFDWARTHNALGVAFARRYKGNRESNVLRALRHFESASEVYSFESYPAYWAIVLRNQGQAYAYLAEESGSHHLERAIACCERVFMTDLRTSFPFDWARTHAVLGDIFLHARTGDPSERLTHAIAHYEAALDVLSPTKYGPDRNIVLASLEQARSLLAEVSQ